MTCRSQRAMPSCARSLTCWPANFISTTPPSSLKAPCAPSLTAAWYRLGCRRAKGEDECICGCATKNSCALPLIELLNGVESVNFLHGLVGPYPHDPGEAQGKAALMTIGPHHVIEGHFQHDLGLDQASKTLVLNRVGKKPLRHLRNFSVGQPGISFADVEQPVAIAHGEGVVAEHAHSLAVTPLHGGHDHVQRCHFTLQFQPGFAAASRGVGRGGV